MKTATPAVAVFVLGELESKTQLQDLFRLRTSKRRLWLSETLSILDRYQEGLNHLCTNEIAVSLIEFGQPEIVTRVI